MTRNLAIGALTLLALAACGTPQEQCIARNTGEYRVLRSLLAETEGNLSRGYAWRERQVTRTEWDECPMILRRKDGTRDVVSRPCLRDVTDTERYREPIDPATETRKRDNLRAKLAQLSPGTKLAVSACRKAFPE